MVINPQRQYIYVLGLASFITIDKLAQNPNLIFFFLGGGGGGGGGGAGVSEFFNKESKFV